MTITMEINEVLKIAKEIKKIESVVGRVKAATITKKALIEKLEKGAVEMRQQTDAIRLTVLNDTIFIDIETEFLLELTKAYGDIVKGVVSLATTSETKMKGLFSKWTKTK
jgi:hypothetical protein